MFHKARRGDTKLQHIIARYERILHAEREKERWKDHVCDQLKWQRKLRNRPIMTDAYLRPSAFNRALTHTHIRHDTPAAQSA
ncbi:hypothetical protein FIBSPDRAFT_945531 [Athelia psychrophila]|uniref:Uncharacterized protein n=1 Tax=Athelia psychrophila TaxID=1759441 RepID=A0A166TW36_9AGAM|nr:hypothetical protein FIBSPDRAFT_945531 [Fibularhizoctonia sp. CBS 109695]